MHSASTMYGRIGKISAVSGQRDALAAILLEATREMPGCLSYVVATVSSDPDAEPVCVDGDIRHGAW